MPMRTIDPESGVIATDWANMDGLTNEYFKITVNVLSANQPSDAIEVEVAKRVWYKGKWGNMDVNPSVAQELKQAILTEAQSLRNRGKY